MTCDLPAFFKQQEPTEICETANQQADKLHMLKVTSNIMALWRHNKFTVCERQIRRDETAMQACSCVAMHDSILQFAQNHAGQFTQR